MYAGDTPVDDIDPTGHDDMVSLGATIAGFGILATLAYDTPPSAGFNRTAAGGQIYANLRAREAGGIIFSHLYIEYVDMRSSTRDIFEALPDFSGSVGEGNLHGMAPRAWGTAYHKGDDPDAPKIGNRPVYESEDDSSSPLIGVNEATFACLQNARAYYNGLDIPYDTKPISNGHNSNWWAVHVCDRCGLSYPDGLPGIVIFQ
jgi:hypothetical protein